MTAMPDNLKSNNVEHNNCTEYVCHDLLVLASALALGLVRFLYISIIDRLPPASLSRHRNYGLGETRVSAEFGPSENIGVTFL
jgi:hypothetical protein